MDHGHSEVRPSAAAVAARRGVPIRQVVRDHLLFGLAFAGFLLAVLALAGAL